MLIVDTAIAFGGTLAVARNLLKHLDSNLIDASLVSACSDGFVSHGFAGEADIRLLAPRGQLRHAAELETGDPQAISLDAPTARL